MAWTATIKQKGIQDKAFLVNVLYDNGSIQFNEILDMTGGSVQVLSDRIASRLALLETTQALIPQIATGPFTPTVASQTPQTPLQIFKGKLRILQNAQILVNLGLLATGDSGYTQAFSDAQAAFDPSFVSLI